MKQGPETKLVKKMRDAGAALYGDRLVTVKYHGDQFSEAGVSDLLCCLDGVFVAVEVKAPESYGGSVERAIEQGPTLKQRAFVARVIKAGGVAGFAATVDQYMDLLALAVESGDPEDYVVERGVWRHLGNNTPCIHYPDSIRWTYTDETLLCGHARRLTCNRLDD